MCLELSGLAEQTDTGVWVGVASQDGSAVGKKSILSGCKANYICKSKN